MKQINERLWISPQIATSDIAELKQQGFTGIINNRPDSEERGQPAAATNRVEAEAQGLSYTHIPIVPGQISEDQVRSFQKALDEDTGPVLAHCKSGTRSATLFAIGEVMDGRMTRDQVRALGEEKGIDLTGAVKWLEGHGYS